MKTRDEIKEFLHTNYIHNTVDALEDPDDLCLLLDIALEEHSFNCIGDILRKLPRSDEFDAIKQKAINNFADKYTPFALTTLLSLIYNDELKLELLNKYIDKIDEDFEVTIVINSLYNDETKIKAFSDYIQYYDSETFSDYLRKIKDDTLRTREFELYKNQYPDFRLDWIASSYSTDEKRIEVFNSNFNESKVEQIPVFINWLHNDELKIMCLDYFCDLIPKDKIWYITSSVKTQENKITLLKKYSERMTDKDLQKLLLGIKDIKLRAELLEGVHNLMDSENIMNVIIEFDSEQLKEELFNKYIELFKQHDFYTMYLYVDDDNKESFLDKYISHYSSYALYRIFAWIYHYADGDREKESDKFLDKYIDLFNPYYLSLIINTLLLDKKNIKEISKSLLSKTKNKDTIKMIYNAIALVNYKYFLKELYINNSIYTQEERDICNNISKGNPYFFSYFIFDLLNIPELKNNLQFLEKISKYPIIAQQIVDLYKRKPSNLNLLLKLLEVIYQYDINQDSISNIIIESFSDSKNQFLNIIDSKELTREDLLTLIYKLIITNKRYKDIIDVKINSNSDLISYKETLTNRLDKSLSESENPKDIKNIVLHKLFGISLSEANALLNKYCISIDKVDNNKYIKYLKDIKMIVDNNNKDSLIKTYYNYPSLSTEEKIIMNQEITKTFNQILIDSLYKIKEQKPQTTIKFGENEIPVYAPNGDFYLLVNSISAYVFKGRISDYNEFWNKNESFQNHGICCSLISNQNVCQTAPIEDVIVGFDDFSNKSIQLADSSDISSINDDYDLRAYSTRFMTPQDYIDNTRTSHNELVLERAELRTDTTYNYMNIQPSYVIIYDWFDDNKIYHSLKASLDLHIPVVYLKPKEIALSEKNIIEQYEQYVIDTLDLNVLKKLIIRLENNIYGFGFSQPDIAKAIFDPQAFEIFMNNLYEKIYKSLTKNEIDQQNIIKIYNEIISILENEKNKCNDSRLSNTLDKSYYIERAKYYINLIEERVNQKIL